MEIVKFKDNKYGVRLISHCGYRFAGTIGSSAKIYTWEPKDVGRRNYWAMGREQALDLYELIESTLKPDCGEVEEGLWT